MSSASRGLAPREGLECLLEKMGRTGCWWSRAVGRRQASLGTPVPRTLTVSFRVFDSLCWGRPSGCIISRPCGSVPVACIVLCIY